MYHCILLYYKSGIFHSTHVYDNKENILKQDSMKRLCTVLAVILCAFCLSSCKAGKIEGKKLRDIEYTVVDKSEIPEELAQEIEQAKCEEMKMCYGDQGYLYIVRGYGERDTTGYSVKVDACYETENGIYLRTDLLGPDKNQEILDKKTFPYLVIKMEYTDKQVIYE